jgi:hypothetical protein
MFGGQHGVFWMSVNATDTARDGAVTYLDDGRTAEHKNV